MAGTTTITAGRRARTWNRTAALVRAFLAMALLAPGAATAAERPVGAAPGWTPPPPIAPAPVAPPPAPVPVAETPPPAAPAPDQEFELRVRALEEQVAEVKEGVFRSKARLQLLGERAARGDLGAGAHAVIVHKNEMGGAFALQSIQYRLDGATVLERVDAGGDLARQDRFEVWNGRTMPGKHTLVVTAIYRGDGYGFFSYLEGYQLRTTATYEFQAEGGKLTTIEVVGFEKGGLLTELKDRPAIRFDVSVAQDEPTRPAEAKR